MRAGPRSGLRGQMAYSNGTRPVQNGLLLAARVDSQTIKSAVASATRSEFLTARSSRSSRAHAAASVGRRGHREVLPRRRRLVVHGSFSLTTERRRRRARRQLRAASRRHRHFEKWRPRRRPNVLYLECRPRWLSQSAASAPLPKVPTQKLRSRFRGSGLDPVPLVPRGGFPEL